MDGDVGPLMRGKITAESIRGYKGRRPVGALTAYDYPTARLLDEAGVDVILVGDSLGMVVLGYPDTTHVTMADMLHHVRAVARSRPRALLAADMPYGSYPDACAAVRNARQLCEAGAEVVKAEGGRGILEVVEAIVGEGMPFLGHLGMLPQRIVEEGGKYRIKGRSEEERQALVQDALALERAGAFAIVLELVVPEVAAEVSQRLSIPTIGIGSGRDCDGQILVTQDLTGGFPWFTPKHVVPLARTGEDTREAVGKWMASLGG